MKKIRRSIQIPEDLYNRVLKLSIENERSESSQIVQMIRQAEAGCPQSTGEWIEVLKRVRQESGPRFQGYPLDQE